MTALSGLRWQVRQPIISIVSGCIYYQSHKLIAVGDDGTFLCYNGSWTIPIPPGTLYRQSECYLGTLEVDIFFIGDGGYIAHYTGSIPGGLMDSGTTENLYNVWGSSGVDVFAVGANGTILHYSHHNYIS